MDEPIHIRSQVSFAVMKIQAPNICQEFPLKNTDLPKSEAVLKGHYILRLTGNVCISDHLGSQKHYKRLFGH